MTLPRYYRHNTEVLPLYSGLLHCLCTVFTVGRPVLLPAVSFTASIEFDQFYCFKLKRTCSVQFAVVRRFCFGFVCVPQLLQGTATATGRLTAAATPWLLYLYCLAAAETFRTVSGCYSEYIPLWSAL